MTTITEKPSTDDPVQAFIDRVLKQAPPLSDDKRDFLTRIFSHT